MLIHNGELIKDNQAENTFINRAFLYGDGIFDTIRVFNGVPLFIDKHFFRLQDAAKFLHYTIPADFWKELHNQIRTLIKQSGYSSARLRITIFRSGKGFFRPQNHTVDYTIQIQSLKENQYQSDLKGLTIDVYQQHLKPLSKLSSIKTCSALPAVLASIYAQKNQLDDVIMLNELGSMAEATSSNIFLLVNNVLYTPDKSQGILPGIMRQQVIEAAQSMKVEVRECQLPPEIMYKADEIFLTNVISGIRRVKAYQTRRFYHDFSDKLIEKINQKMINLTKDLQEM